MGYRLLHLLSVVDYELEVMNSPGCVLIVLLSIFPQSSLSSLVLARLSELASVVSASSGGAVRLDGVAGLLAAAELPSLSCRSAHRSVS